MRVVRSVIGLRKILELYRKQGKTIGFVPTMGYFHEGHLALMRRAKKVNDICVVSIYVNPKQFAPSEDLSSYPRDFKRDSTLLKKENVDIVFFPSDNDIYPQGYLTYIDVEQISRMLCGAFRPGHFRGVATIVAKLLNMVQPKVMYLGAKDAQQVAVLKAMVRDLNIPVRVETVDTVRESDGLAMSSRNVYLSPQERQEAPILYQALRHAKECIKQGEDSSASIINGIKKYIAAHSSAKIQYVACVDMDSLEPLNKIKDNVLIALAVFLGKTRLIDNVIIRNQKSNKK